MGPAGQAEEDPGAMAVVGSSLVIGSASAVTQAVRDRGREDLRPIQTDARYRQAARFLPAQAGAWWYDDGVSSAGFLWENLKEHATQEKARERGAAERRDGNLDGDFPDDFPMPPPDSHLPLPIHMMLRQLGLEEAVDLTTLPPFPAVRKYFGPSIGFLKATEDGLRIETTVCKPPAEE
jgi:hypothetical protein